MAKMGPEKAPNTTMAVIAIVLLVGGLGWSIYQANPGEALRAPTDAEIKAKKEAIKEEEHRKREEARKLKRGGRPEPSGH